MDAGLWATIGFVLAGGLGAAAWALSRSRAGGPASAFAVEQAARRLRLVVHRDDRRRPRAMGRVGRVAVRVELVAVGPEPSVAEHTVIRVGGGLPEGLTITAEGLLSSVVRAVAPRDVEIGDPILDAAAILRGEPAALLIARLGPDVRKRVLRAVREGATLAHGEWVWRQPGAVEPERIVGLVRVLAAAAEALVDSTPDDVRDALRDRVAADPEPGVRLRALELLRAEDVVSPDALRALCDDDEAEVALAAALALGDEGRDALLRLLDAEARPIRRAAALALAARPPGPGADRVEAVLIELLDAPDVEIVVALGEIGTAAAIEPLQRVAATGAGLAPLAFEARAALGWVRGRLAGVERGGLAIAAPGGGEVAIAAAGKGALSETSRG